VENPEKVREKLATTEKTAIRYRAPAGQQKASDISLLDGEKVFPRDQVLEIRNVDGWLQCRPQETPARRMGPADRAV
jgi:hypothetical protein